MEELDLVITEDGETYPREEVIKFGGKVLRDAIPSEILEYEKEEMYWRKQASEEQHEMYYHDLPD
jgi:hypothetical protein